MSTGFASGGHRSSAIRTLLSVMSAFCIIRAEILSSMDGGFVTFGMTWNNETAEALFAVGRRPDDQVIGNTAIADYR